MAEFLSAYRIAESNEGGYVTDKSDRGGETYKGISRKFFPGWRGWPLVDAAKPLNRGEIIDSLELDGMVKQFYKANFWDKMRGDELDSQEVAVFVYDWFINSGKHAITNLQKCLGIKADGQVGAITITAANNADDVKLLAKLKQARIDYYHAIVKNDPSQKKFLRGWLNRTEALA